MRGRRDLEESPVAGLSMVAASCCSAVKDTPDFEQLLFWSENKWHFCKILSLLLPCLHFFCMFYATKGAAASHLACMRTCTSKAERWECATFLGLCNLHRVTAGQG